MGYQIESTKRYVIHVEWPHSYNQDMVIHSDKDMQPLTKLEDAIREAERWKVDGYMKESTTVTVYEEIMRIV